MKHHAPSGPHVWQNAACLVQCVVVIFTVVACHQPTPRDVGAKPMRVELSIFSGRPNPVWELTAAESAEFIRRFRTLPNAQAGHAVPDEGKLGYSGLIVTGHSDIESFASIVVAGGVVRGSKLPGSQVYLDKDQALERWLVSTGSTHLEPDIYNEVAKELRLP